MEKTGVGVIGCGSISGNHFHALRAAEGAELRAVCDTDEGRLRRAAEEQGAEAFADWREMIRRPEIGAVHICTPHDLHAEMASAALRAGKHVLCEKPMGVSLAEAQEMERTSRETGKTLLICFQNRYNGASLRIREIIDGGSMGRLLGGSGILMWNRAGAYYEESPWRGRWRREGGSVLINQSIHTLDLLRWFAGELRVVSCAMSVRLPGRRIETEDTCDMLLTGPAGERFLFFASVCAADNFPVQIRLLFEKGELFLEGTELTIRSPEGMVREDYAGENCVGKAYWGSSHSLLIADFYRRIREGREPFILPSDALETMRLVEAAYRSASPEDRKRPE